MTDRTSVAEIKALLQMRVRELVERVLPTARFAGAYATVNLKHPGRPGGQLVVWLRGSSPGAWKDYLGGDKGDVIDLVAYAVHNRSRPYSREDRIKAIEWARGFLGLADMPPAERVKARRLAEHRAAERQANEAEREARARRRAFDMWNAARPIAQGAAAVAYLAGRGIRLDQVPNLEADLRFAPSLEWWMGAQRDESHRKLRPGPSFPAIVSAMRNEAGAIMAVHCTFLAPDGSGKAPVDKPKLMWPGVKGCVIRIAKGASGRTPEEAAAAGERDLVVICEGLEDGLSIAMARPDLRVWACGSLAGIAGAPALPCVRGFIVAADNDWQTPAAVAQLERALERLRTHGVPVTVAHSPTGKDFNDCLREGNTHG